MNLIIKNLDINDHETFKNIRGSVKYAIETYEIKPGRRNTIPFSFPDGTTLEVTRNKKSYTVTIIKGDRPK